MSAFCLDLLSLQNSSTSFRKYISFHSFRPGRTCCLSCADTTWHLCHLKECRLPTEQSSIQATQKIQHATGKKHRLLGQPTFKDILVEVVGLRKRKGLTKTLDGFGTSLSQYYIMESLHVPQEASIT